MTAAARLEHFPLSSTVHLADTAMRLRGEGRSIVDLSAGRAVEHTPSYICRAAEQALRDGVTHQTASRGAPAFLAACAAKLARDNGIDVARETGIVATLGVKQGLTLALLAVLNPGDEVLVEDPCFVSYQPLIRLAGATPVPVPLRAENDFRWREADLARACSPRTRAILLNSPNNPTGTVHTAEDLAIVARVAQERDLAVIADEVYERVTWGGRRHICLATLPGMRSRTVGVMGFTKSFSMGGWRIGFAYGPEAVVSAMVRLQQHLQTCASSFVQAAAAVAAATTPPAEIVDLWREWERRCLYMAEQLNGIPGVRCSPPEGGFYAWPDISAFGVSSQDLARRLLEDAGVVVVPGSAFGATGEGRLRLTCVRSWEELEEALTRIKRMFEPLAREAAR